MNRTSKPMNGFQWGQLLLLGVVWGGAFYFGRVAVAELHPLVLVFQRVLTGALALIAWMLITGQSPLAILPNAAAFAGLAVLNNIIPFSLIFTGQQELGAGLAAILNATTPFWTIMVANVLTADEKFSTYKLAGTALGMAGTAVLVGPDAIYNLSGPVWPKLLIIAAAISYAFAAIYAKQFKGMRPSLVATGQLCASSVLMLPVALLIGGPGAFFAESTGTFAAVIGLGVISTAFAYILYFSLIGSAGATNASLVTLLIPASASFLGYAFLGETLELIDIAGLALITAGLLTIDGRVFLRR